MKILKTASGKQKIKLSKKEWQAIGKKAGWKVSQDAVDYSLEDIPRTFLFYGAPGTGKSYQASRWAQKWGLKEVFVDMDQKGWDAAILSGENCVFKIDEIDRHITLPDSATSVSEGENHQANRLMDVLERVSSGPNNVFVFATANFISNLGDALVNRFEVVEEISGPNWRQLDKAMAREMEIKDIFFMDRQDEDIGYGVKPSGNSDGSGYDV